MKTFLKLFFLTTLTFNFSSSQFQNLCRDAATAGKMFADDPSGCSRYLYCEYDENNVLLRVHQLRCLDPAFPVFFNDACFSNAEIPCPSESLQICPELNQPIFYARYVESGTEECRDYSLCQPGTGGAAPTILSCPPDTVFDRSSGTCNRPENAPCGVANMPEGPECPADVPGVSFVRFPLSCTRFIVCLDGTKIGENECTNGLHFDPDTGNCNLPENMATPCEYVPTRVPFAPSKQLNKNPLFTRIRGIRRFF